MHQGGFVIAIDGPSGVGKSTVARAVAAELGLSYVESGAMYRAIALLALERSIPLDNAAALGELAAAAVFRFESGRSGNRIWVNGKVVTDAIRTPEVTQAASEVSVHPEVRAPLVARQRQLGRGGIVMEGRDIGTVVFPDAPLKIFLRAPAEVRGQRRMKDAESAGHASADAITSEITARDQRDESRETSPLKPAPDAIQIDTTDLSAADVARKVVELARSRRVPGLEKPTANR